MAAACIFCKIIKGEIPSFKLFESQHILAFLDINPLSRGHALVIPKHHGEKLTDIPDEQLREILPVVKKLALATGAENYNILQNNGRIAHQVVDHVHFHMDEGWREGGADAAADTEAERDRGLEYVMADAADGYGEAEKLFRGGQGEDVSWDR
ncbi:Adenosine 5'-monophosphoramidase [Xylographa trunciseda]|nr:Adenosine 5'-monophosphoramidase [Xylographa trunciseda]